MSAKTMNDLKGMLCEELDEIVATGQISSGDLDSVHKLTDTIKNIYKIEGMEEDGYSYDGDWRANGTYSNGNYSNGNYSNRRSGSRHYVRAHYSNAGENEMLADRMDSMLRSNTSMSSQDRDTIRRAMDMIRY